MPRPQFTLKTLLWLMAVVAAFFGGSKWGRLRQLEEIKSRYHKQHYKVPVEVEPSP